MNVAIVGSRDYPDMQQVRDFVNKLPQGFTIVSGGARGVDRVAAEAARQRGMNVIEFIPDWSQGKGAGMARNAEIVAHADAVIAFWDGKSRGTKNTIDRALSAAHVNRVTVYKPGRKGTE